MALLMCVFVPCMYHCVGIRFLPRQVCNLSVSELVVGNECVLRCGAALPGVTVSVGGGWEGRGEKQCDCAHVEADVFAACTCYVIL